MECPIAYIIIYLIFFIPTACSTKQMMQNKRYKNKISKQNQNKNNLTNHLRSIYKLIRYAPGNPPSPGGGRYSLTIAMWVCAAQWGRIFGTPIQNGVYYSSPFLEQGIIFLIVSITKCSLVIGSARTYLLPNCSAVMWVSNYSCPI